MQYMMLLFGDEAGWAAMSADEQEAEMTQWFQYDAAVRAAGAYVSGEALQPTATATVVRAGDGDSFSVTDGPFAETKEALGGYYVIDVPSLDEAIEWAKRCPAKSIEIRPIMVFEQ